MRRRGPLLLAPLALCALFGLGCPGDGSQLVEPMVPDGGDGETVTLAELQQNIFGGVCSNCHTVGGLGSFMYLDSEENTYASLVGQPSFELKRLLRVAPGDPESSYLVWKIEGRPEILGERMPPPSAGEAALSAAEIAAIRQWILDGAAP